VVNRAIKLAYLVFGFSAEGGGASRFAFSLSRALKVYGYDIGLYGLWDFGTKEEKETIEEIRKEGFEISTLAKWDSENPYQGFWNSFTNLRQILHSHPTDILHSHSEFGDVVALLVKLLSGNQIIYRTVHNGHLLEWRKRPLRRYLFSYLLNPLLFDFEIGVSPSIVTQMNNRLIAGFKRRKAVYIKNAIDLERFENLEIDKAKIRESLGIPANAFLVGSIGRLVEEKGFDFLIEAVRHLIRDHPLIYLIIIGSGPLEDFLKLKAANLGVASNIIFTGYRKDVEKLLKVMDIYVSTSLWEGMSTTILESMAAGTPIVATNIPGNRDLIENGYNGWLVPAQNSRFLADTLLTAIRDTEISAIYSQRSLNIVHSHTYNEVAANHHNLYQKVLSKNHT
jgi:glycosyltransferase involved in cell wall biosynthesis